MGGRWARILLDCEVDRDQRPQRKHSFALVLSAGHTQEGGEMTDVSKAIYSGDWELYPCKGKVTIQDFEHCKIVLTEAEALHVWRVPNCWVERNAEAE